MKMWSFTVKIDIPLKLMHDEGVALPNHFLRPCDGSWCGEESPLLVFYITLPEIDRPLS